MNYRLRTSEKCKQTLEDLQAKTGITPNILCRYAIGLSLLLDEPINLEQTTDTRGQEFNRQVLLGQYDGIFKALMIKYEERNIEDEDYFPDYTKAHIERGVEHLKSSYNLTGNREKFLINLTRAQNGGHI